MKLTAQQRSILARAELSGWLSVVELAERQTCIQLWRMGLLRIEPRDGLFGYLLTAAGQSALEESIERN